ncbi:MAG: DUF3800 domain-containing protein [Caldilineaceae bacterium]
MFSLTFAGDESGDVSFAFTKGASTHFLITIIAANADLMQLLLQDVRQQSNLPANYEFSFHGLTASALRRRVFTALADTEFSAWAVAVNKAKLADSFRVMRPVEFYLYFVSETIRLIPSEQRIGATLLLDEFASPKHLPGELRRILKARSIPRHFKQIVAKRSRSEPLIQVADLLAGALHRHIVSDDHECYRLIQHHFRVVADFGEE